MGAPAVLAFDLGASSGKALIGQLREGRLAVREIRRFANDPVQAGGRLYWDILRLYHEIKQGLVEARRLGFTVSSIGIDSWAVDFGLLDRSGELLGNPYHYRDHHTHGVMDEVCRRIGKERIFRKTGIQFLPFNTIYQLAAMRQAGSPLLEKAETLLMIPDLLRYFLTGEKRSEFTNATTTQLLDAQSGMWDTELMSELGLPSALFPPTVQPGTLVGRLLPSVQRELGVPDIPVIAVGEHDTASAVAAVPADSARFAYLSCGTWSLLGTELELPVINEQALEWNFTNEGGVGGTYRLLRNIMGLWLLQQCKKVWETEGRAYSHEQLVALAERAEPHRSFIDPDHPMFLNPPSMPAQIREYCRQTNQREPETHGDFVRCVLEGLAFKYRLVLERTEQLSGVTFDGLHMVGGGVNNALLCQWTANAIARPVWAGPNEASAVGNLAVQLVSQGFIRSLSEARSLIRASFPPVEYAPQFREEWQHAYTRWYKVIEQEMK